jgi:acylaminoacyl-peptidase
LAQYDDEGDTKVARIDMNGNITPLLQHVGGLSIGRPYSGGDFSSLSDKKIAFTMGKASHPSDLGYFDGKKTHRLTEVNKDIFQQRRLGKVQELSFTSSHDGLELEGWIITPPDFDSSKTYPMILEIHGGPFAAYGPWFSFELQHFASQGYVVFYMNPRGSTSYGAEFANKIHHNYPNEDYYDLMSGVDAVIDQGYVDKNRLFVTGGSGGGVLTAWIIGHTDRFKAAVVAKPVINWYSFVLYADNPATYYKYWFPGYPWEHQAHYMKRSPISYVGNVTTPTMILTGEEDLRTPMAESEQYYGALQIQGIESALVRIPNASHGIANRPSNLITKIAAIEHWFNKFDKPNNK